MLEYLLVAIGGALGSVLRFWVSGAVAQRIGEFFPYNTLLINITGSFVIGFVAALNAPEGRFLVAPSVRQFLMVGFCGGYTTFSSFSLQTLNLARDGEWFLAGVNAVVSLVACLVAVWLGQLLALSLNRT